MKETIVDAELALKNRRKELEKSQQKYQRRYKLLKESKLCMSCGKRKKYKNHVRCKQCMAKLRDQANGIYQPH